MLLGKTKQTVSILERSRKQPFWKESWIVVLRQTNDKVYKAPSSERQWKLAFISESRESLVKNIKDIFYNEEFDPGSGWTLATGLTHASRGAADR